MTAQQLKNSILQMAVQGKLVPQDPNDEPASILLERIRTEKQQLVKEGKIKKDKNESVIYRAPKDGNSDSDNLPYRFFERFADGTERDITDELPFEVPETWEWVRLDSLCEIITKGSSPKWQGISYTNDSTDGILFITSENVGTEELMLDNKKYLEKRFNEIQSRSVLKNNDILTNIVGASIGRSCLYNLEHSDCNINQAVALIRLLDDNLCGFLIKYLNSGTAYSIMLDKQVENARANISLTTLAGFLIPLPPLIEQKRIVARIEELLPYIEAYDTAEQKLSALNSAFPDQLKKSVLQAAVQGKLVPQDTNDEPASILLERIRAEREQLIKDGKLKRSKNESVIFRRDNSHYEKIGDVEQCIDDELPFEIPENWVWVRLGNVIQLISGQDMTPDKYNADRQGIPYLTGASNIENESVVINRWTTEPKSIAIKGDLLITCKGTVGAMAFFDFETCHIARQIMAIRISGLLSYKYIKVFIEPYVITLKAAAKSMIPGISRDNVLNALLPLPPPAEQKRIVAVIDILTATINQIPTNQ